ncbi:MAG TPA: hypothetical protein VKU40_01745, partial [Thermoanaerobaculia bacterium]|nr:hypothetical protein [Thermoanaerobaculia bacterium]
MLVRRTILAMLTIQVSLSLSLPLALPAAAGDWAEGDVTTSDGVSIHYYEAKPASGEEAGDEMSDGEAAAPALLFVPGWTMSARIWEPQIEHFA